MLSCITPIRNGSLQKSSSVTELLPLMSFCDVMNIGSWRLFHHDRVMKRATESRERTHTVTICIPARNEETTVGSVVRLIRRELVDRLGYVDEVMVVDDRSTDDTAQTARRAGARVVSSWDACRHPAGSLGKGDALWTSIQLCNTDLIGWVDADLREVTPRSLIGLFEPLQSRPETQLVKGRFERLVHGQPHGPGRVTALTAKPLVRLLFPELSWVQEPLGGLFAGRTESFRQIGLEVDYGVDVGILLDMSVRFGVRSIVEVNLGSIAHRNRGLGELSEMAEQVARTVLDRAVRAGRLSPDVGETLVG